MGLLVAQRLRDLSYIGNTICIWKCNTRAKTPSTHRVGCEREEVSSIVPFVDPTPRALRVEHNASSAFSFLRRARFTELRKTLLGSTRKNGTCICKSYMRRSLSVTIGVLKATKFARYVPSQFLAADLAIDGRWNQASRLRRNLAFLEGAP